MSWEAVQSQDTEFQKVEEVLEPRTQLTILYPLKEPTEDWDISSYNTSNLNEKNMNFGVLEYCKLTSHKADF